MSILEDPVYKLIHGNVDIYKNFDEKNYEDVFYGWNSDHNFFGELIKEKQPKYILEIGSWLGKSAINMGNFIKNNSYPTKIVCVDTWLGSLEFVGDKFPAARETIVKNGLPRTYDYFMANVKKHGLEDIIIPFPQISYNALKFFMLNKVFFDMIYVDGSNYYEEIKSDIDLSWDILTPDGFIFGDDYRNFHWPHIAIAVNEFVNDNKLFNDFSVDYDCYWKIKKKKYNDLKYVITSHPKYTKALECMLDSMLVANVPPGDIIVVLGDCSNEGKYLNEKIKIRPGVNYIPIENNLYEYNFFIGVMKAIELGVAKRIDDFVLLHDTCLASCNFLQDTKNLARSYSDQIIWNNRHGSYNLGVFKYAGVKAGYLVYKGLKTLDKHDAILMEHNRHHLSPKRFIVSQKYHITVPRRRTNNHVSVFDVYNEGRNRTIAHISCMDLLKFYLWVPHGGVHPNNID